MTSYLTYLLGALLLAILGVLVYGVVTMGRGGTRSNRLMRWRIGLQFAALVVILLLFPLPQG
jgi:Hypoxia induced protein conserved region